MSEFQPKQNPEGATPQRNNLPPQQATPQLAKGDSTEKEEDQRFDKVSQSANLVSDNGSPGAQTAYVHNPSRQHGLQPRQMGRIMGRTMNRWGNPLPSGSSTQSQEPLETEAKYPSHQIKMKGDISSARPVAVNVPEESRLSEVQELPPERVIPSSQNNVETKGPGEWLKKVNPFAQEEVDSEKQTHLRQEFEIYSAHKSQLIREGHTIVPNDKGSSKEELAEDFSKKREKFLNRMENNQRSFWGTDRYDRLMEKWFPDYDLVIQNKVTAVKTSTALKIQETNQTIDKLIAKIKEAISVADGDVLKAEYLLNDASCYADEALAKKQEAEKVLDEYGKDKKETMLPCYDEVIGKYQLLVGQLQHNMAGVQEDKTIFSTVLGTLNSQQTRLSSFSNKLSGINDVQQVITFTEVEFISLSESVSNSITQAQDTGRKTLSVAEEEVKNTFEQGTVDLDASDAEVAGIKQKEIARREAERKRKAEEERKRKEAEKERLLKLSQDGMKGETALSATLPTNQTEHLKSREGVRKDVYNDGVKDTITVGVGHKLTKEELKKYKQGQEVSQETIDEWLKDDAERNYKRALEQAKEIGHENQLLVNALFHMCFQNGENWNTRHKKTWSYLKEQNWVAAAKEAADSTWFAQTPKRVLDFQVALLAIAGEKNDYESLKEFNKDAIVKRKPNLPDLYDFQVDTKGLKTKKEQEIEDKEAKKQAWAKTKDELWEAYSDYENSKIDMILFGKKLEAHTGTHAHDIGLIIDKMGFMETDNLAYVILKNSSDVDLKGMDSKLLTKILEALDTLLAGSEAKVLYGKEAERVMKLLKPNISKEEEEEGTEQKNDGLEVTKGEGDQYDAKLKGLDYEKHYRTQSPTPSIDKKYKDKQDAGWVNCYKVAKNMAYGYLYGEDTNHREVQNVEGFKRKMSTTVKAGILNNANDLAYVQSGLIKLKYLTKEDVASDAKEPIKIPKTAAAIEKFQTDNKLEVDGKFGSGSERKMAELTDEKVEKYEHVIGEIGDGYFLSLLREDKSKRSEVEGEQIQGLVKNAEKLSTKEEDNQEIETLNIANDKIKVEGTQKTQANWAVWYIEKCLAEGKPVVAGTNHTYNRNLQTGEHNKKLGYNEGTTDHYITIVGKGKDKKGDYYSYFDPGTGKASSENDDIPFGADTEINRLYKDKDNPTVFIDPSYHQKKKYHLTLVLLYKEDADLFKSTIEKNKKLKSAVSNNDYEKYKSIY